jgi:hypothetical protein
VPKGHRPPGLTRDTREDIVLPSGEIAMPRARFAKTKLHVSDRTAARMNLPTIYMGGVAHVLVNESMEIVAARAERRNQPPPIKQSKQTKRPASR